MRDLTLEKFSHTPKLDFENQQVAENQKNALKKVRKEFEKEHGLYIKGEFVKGDNGLFKSRNPSNTDEVIGAFQSAGRKQALDALSDAWKAFKSWQYVSARERADYLFEAAKIAERRRYEINAWMISEAGKNWVEADGDTAEAIDFLKYYAYEALRMDKGMAVIDSEGENNKTIYLPMGAGVTISPWNFPFAIFTGMAMAPVVTGNCVVAKPAPDTPKMGHLLAEILHETGLPPGVFNFVTGDDTEVGEGLATNKNTRFISFTGSMNIGLHLNEIAAARDDENQNFIKRIITELGGKNAVVVDSDADLESAADAIITSAFGFQGQKCSAGSRVVAHKDVYQKLLEMVTERTEAIEVGDAADNYQAGPVINHQAVEKINAYIEIGKKEAQLVIGGVAADTPNPGHYIQPTIFADASPDARIAQEEIFGPVVTFIKADSTEHALEIANGVRYGLTGAYFSQNPEKIDHALRHFHVGNLYINRACTAALVGAQPFGGFKMSGSDAKAGGRDYLLNFLLPKSLTVRPKENVNVDLKYFRYSDR